MNMNDLTHRWSRRTWLRAAAASGSLVTLERLAPGILAQAAEASAQEERILVVLEMAGGNDGLNMVVPHRDEAYRKARPVIGIPADATLTVDDDIGLHPAMRSLADLLEQGRFAVVQGVGYPNPNRSHFESMDIWHSCRHKGGVRDDGWLGRYLEAAQLGDASDPPALHLGREKQPLALMSRGIRVPSIQSLAQFRLRVADRPELVNAIQDLADNERAEADELLGFIQSSTSDAIATSQRMESIGASYQPSESYPSSQLGQKFETIAKLIASGLTTKVFYLRIDGFDTHANQPDAHAGLLRELSDAVATFVRDANSQGFGDRILVMAFSEFGRRVQENASEGTDHGTAGPVLLAGNQVRAGLIGSHPSLSDLDHGDLRHHTDFRQVYAGVLQQWLSVPAEAVLGAVYDPIKIVQG